MTDIIADEFELEDLKHDAANIGVGFLSFLPYSTISMTQQSILSLDTWKRLMKKRLAISRRAYRCRWEGETAIVKG